MRVCAGCANRNEATVMPRPKKDGRYINYYIDRKIFEELENYAQEQGQTVTTAIENILSQFFEEQEEQTEK